ncbi:hypothetical protein ABB37_01950 [Leptomonas pyrrhocoris]|uniref:Exosome-associated protein 3 n=1 Tax=Leptomonas pyrrhocoris TaxID=157538 RepID=A0A0N1J563_LEPPY|nr:hypothetical protein ABB37_01950 [Leptomonas pyrrhocoris]KPA83694.1 hypothetical protein ABB37_01950 [Leptomonas pyrrhocoris]|eukprot:XP_015662133.1 hypothetical protein ABB37_01950 [Leptomonas pyrrhocoris]
MDVDSEVEPTLQEMARRIAVMRVDLLPALRRLDEDTILSYYSVDEQARLYLSAAFTLALSLYSLDKITHRQIAVGGTAAAAAPRLTGAGTRHRSDAPAGPPPNTDTQLVLKIERITEYIKKLQELATLERNKKLSAAAAAVMEASEVAKSESSATSIASKKRARETSPPAPGAPRAHATASMTSKRAKADTAAKEDAKGGEAADDDYGDAQMFSVVSRVAGETGTLVSRLLRQVMPSKTE